jgi:hypothetical protein
MLQNNNVAHFEISGIDVPLPEGWYFHDEGFSKYDSLSPRSAGPQTITARSSAILVAHEKRYRQEVEGMDHEQAKDEASKFVFKNLGYEHLIAMEAIGFAGSPSGMCLVYRTLPFPTGPEVHMHLMYIDEGRDDVNLSTQAHEEQHGISYLPGGLDILTAKITRDRGEPIQFDKIKDIEVAADLNSVHALVRRGFDLSEYHDSIHIMGSKAAKRVKRAIHIYETGDYSNFGFQLEQVKSFGKTLVSRIRD